MAAEYAARVATSENAMQLAKNAANVLAQTIGKTLIPDFKAFAERAGAVTKRVIDWIRAHPELVKWIARLVVVVTALITVLGGVLMAGGMAAMAFAQIYKAVAILSGSGGLGGLVSRVGQLATRFFPMLFNVARALIPILGGVSAPVLAIGAAVAAVAFLIWKYWGPIKAFMVGMWEGIKMAMAPVMDEVLVALAPLAPVWEVISEAIGKAWAWIKALFTPFQATNDQLQRATDNGRTFGLVIGTYLAESIRRTIRVVQTLIAVALAVRTVMMRVMGGIAKYVQGVWMVITGIFSGDFGRIRDGLQRMWTGINAIVMDWPARMMQAGIDMVTGLVGGIRARAQAARDAIGNVGMGIIDRFRGPRGIDAHSPSRVFLRLGDYIMQGLASGIGRSGGLPLDAVTGVSDRLRRLGVGAAMTAAATSTIAADDRPIVPAATNAPPAQNIVYHITVNAEAGATGRDIATQIRTELERFERDRAAKRRSRLTDD